MAWTKSKPRVKWTSPPVGSAPRAVVVVEQPRDWRELAHPDLHHLTDAEFKRRSDILIRLLYFVPRSEYIGWHGGMKRTWKGGDGGNGAYMTDAQAQAWRDRSVSDHTAGPG